jgi:radical SAM protein with 4Fe4S-binding SPASM domain
VPRDYTASYQSCYGMLFETMIDADCKVYPCLNFWRDEARCLGDLTDATFGEVWKSARRKAVMDEIWRRYDLDQCHFGCKQHHVNETLWELANPPLHVNFL